jgi:hypothetical protein
MAGRTTPQRGLLSTSWTSESMIGKFDSERVTSPHRAEKFRAYAKERKDLGSTGSRWFGAERRPITALSCGTDYTFAPSREILFASSTAGLGYVASAA